MEDIPIPILRTASQALKLPAGKRCKCVLMVTRAKTPIAHTLFSPAVAVPADSCYSLWCWQQHRLIGDG